MHSPIAQPDCTAVIFFAMPRSAVFLPTTLHRLRCAGARASMFFAGLLVLASMLGILHSIAHAPERAQAQAWRDTLGRGAIADGRAENTAARAYDGLRPTSWLSQFFGHKANDRDCQIFDHLCHGPAAPAQATLTLAFAPPVAAVLMTLEGEYIARWTALFDARGPPQSA